MTTAEIISAACAISGPATGAIWYLVSKSQKEATRTLVKEEFAILIDAALAKFKTELNSSTGYRRSESCDLIMKPVTESMRRMEKDIHEVRNQVHASLATAPGQGD